VASALTAPAAHRGSGRSSSGNMTFSTAVSDGSMKRLKDEAHMPAADGGSAVFVEEGNVDAGDRHSAGARRVESREQGQ